LDLKIKVESCGFGEKGLEAALDEKAKEVEMLRHKLSGQEKFVFKLQIDGMYALLYVYNRVDSVVYMLLQCEIPSVKMFMHVSLEV
jgi:hypothetical protein